MLTSARKPVRSLLTDAVESTVRDHELVRLSISIAIEQLKQYDHGSLRRGDFTHVALLLAEGSGTRRSQRVHGDPTLPREQLDVSTPAPMTKTENLTKEDES